MLNENIIITGDNKSTIREWKIEGDNLILISKKEKAHNDGILTLLNIGNGYIASGSGDKLIKIWKLWNNKLYNKFNLTLNIKNEYYYNKLNNIFKIFNLYKTLLKKFKTI